VSHSPFTTPRSTVQNNTRIDGLPFSPAAKDAGQNNTKLLRGLSANVTYFVL
jgi:hypothetical protein